MQSKLKYIAKACYGTFAFVWVDGLTNRQHNVAGEHSLDLAVTKHLQGSKVGPQANVKKECKRHTNPNTTSPP